MTTVQDTAPARRRARGKSTYLPPQHGAWAFLGLPLVLGSLLAPASPVLVVLGFAWIAAYPWSYAMLGLLRDRRPQRFTRPAVFWSILVIPSAIALVTFRPWLVWIGLLYLALFAVNLGYARRHNERAIGNDLVFIVECSALVPLMWAVGASAASQQLGPALPVPVDVWILAAVCALVLVGSTLHVKSLIRERSDPRYARASRLFATACLPLALALAVIWGLPSGLWLVLPFVVLAIRAFRRPAKPQRPGTIGVIELTAFVITAAASALAIV